MDRREDLQAACEAARAAGQAVLRLQREGFDTARKANQDPVTTADLEADALLKDALLGRFPDDGWLSEETRDDPERLKRQRVWVVDPLDGTKEYTKAIPEFCISVALVENNEPAVGVIYNPSSDEMFTAVRDEGAARNGEPIRADRPGDGKPLIAASRSEVGKGKWDRLRDGAELRPAGSAAYKLCLVASGEVDATFTLAPRNEWDIAAGVLIVTEAGGVVSDRAEQPIRFNQPDPLKNGIFASTRAAREAATDLLRRTHKR
ncbi:MAG: 3'(2'),5'-bisphosphate nucleotidase CysQ [Planctomycetota bacterium]